MTRNNWKDNLKWVLEKCGPCITGMVGAGTAIWLVLIYKIPMASFEKVLESTITLSSILIGFVGVLLGILFTVRNSETIALLFKNKEKYVLKRYFKANITLGMLLVVLSLLLYLVEFINKLEINIQYLIYGLWGFLLFYTLSSTFRIINIIMYILFNENVNENKEPIKVKMNENKTKELKEQYKK